MIYGKSEQFKRWYAYIDPKTCLPCKEMNGTIYEKDKVPDPHPPLHENCRCFIEAMGTILAGWATKNGVSGADYFLIKHGMLPTYYVSRVQAERLGWRPGKSLSDFAPGKMLAGGTYQNRDKKLPDAEGRIWYEADINYQKGKRNTERILLSNGGLIFVTYDHYYTFFEIVRGTDYANKNIVF